MSTVTSADGTAIAYERSGDGAPVILVDGALCYRDSGPSRALAAQLCEHFTVYAYDRRGRGESGDTAPYAVEREVEDIAALVEAAGGSVLLYGISSGAALVLEAASRLDGIRGIALYEAPFAVDGSHTPMPDYRPRLDALLAEDRRADAVRLFMRYVGLPRPIVALMRFMSAWSKLKAVAHTLPYDHSTLEGTQAGAPLPADRWAGATMPALAIGGGKSPEWMRVAMRAVADALPDAEYRTLEGQTHMVKAKVLAPVLAEFFAGEVEVVPVAA
jgi:pimeloyl-ACP methyl ester carboxylesterase